MCGNIIEILILLAGFVLLWVKLDKEYKNSKTLLWDSKRVELYGKFCEIALNTHSTNEEVEYAKNICNILDEEIINKQSRI